ncbi:transcriptional regulator, LysR family [Ferrimonas balearica DSM 9799]|uniref:Transcriptional regulator, LysR family n=1 Tax=Ferrimonas balearica (strain DSM 9799 / CCM 4581 / KCTC 23876 / PAT) TaxID=550540 RepID=E1SMA4_FERBD|nr:LysR family transcriptional regulator [Ferrimonas balearica]ADN77613.1 transcriptional regulator, LysR family [Ferrimonas balearica DSM 9799]MBW3165776.1 LysR family transcriptional regulator [Ferrimonas balearica]MBY5981686.1 LysR family transcriptional regulator [Ferrimonas balearica]
MRTNMIEIRHLRHFQMLCRKGSFRAAAELLRISQPTLTRSIQRMEELLEVKLLDRRRSGVVLTPYGEAVLRHGERIVRDVRQMSQELEFIHQKDWVELTIGAGPIPAETLIGPVLGSMTERFPTLNLELRVEGWERLLRLLESGELHYLVEEIEATGLAHREGLAVQPLPPQPVVFCCSPKHPLMARQEVTLADLLQYPLALPRNLPRPFWQRHFPMLTEGPMVAGRRFIRFDHFLAVKPAIQGGQVLALTPQLSVHRELVAGQLALLRVVDMEPIQAHYGILSLKGRTAPPAAQQLLAAIEQQAKVVVREEPELYPC